ncbi:hypothetical protein PN4B1_16740 [Paenibacillus naphthalenovorans]|uniref:hypothetical protein n=1 Tax=Paenibacillus naphthalenovorans TaxID=162209 RepID=UPI0010B3E216|nr:hypothetical protein [Paenibacillus naphthalenovorans]GCL71769.1 hypothetical protein PN4B1_16740 [Paenibacillus naphthalenovorans]
MVVPVKLLEEMNKFHAFRLEFDQQKHLFQVMVWNGYGLSVYAEGEEEDEVIAGLQAKVADGIWR